MILVTGATGKVGGSALTSLLDKGVAVRALVRDPRLAALPSGVDVVPGDLADPASLGPALDGVDSVFLVWPTIAADHAAPAVIAQIAQRARRVVYLSANGVSSAATEGILGSHAMIERLISDADIEWTFLRPTGFAANTLGWAAGIRADGVVRWFHPAARRSLIHEQDIAAVAALALTSDRLLGQRPVLTGPAAISQLEQAHAIGQAIGRPVRFEELHADAVRRELFPGLPTPVVDGLLAAHAAFVTRPELVTDTVAHLVGRSARTFAEWATDHASDFR
ncbi:NmrA family NAD(P)-binding protein [Kutzneria sp. CA-103260]|uniref:NmrA family NAD(P)-binding protein n=1 Tax=Kutzneria sp. CA-103260 TaxID=2802641 RepID=UPI001BADD39B|nr:NAD(P)H-binding protein [Kutzneria sp. CA-103260]QUQ70190.1 NAD-dependent epimerase/dehydratase family protein [Kutzneria sp. CA-103260]